MVTRRRFIAEPRPAGGGIETFDTDAAHALNRARLAHLASLDLPLAERSVLEVGAGVGLLTSFFVERRCTVVATEARAENLAELRRQRPDVDVRYADVEQSLEHLGRFDIVFCYGLLYHVENPILALRNMESVCDRLLLIETIVCDASVPVLRLDDETKTVSQALRGLAHRPSPSYMALALNRIGFEHVYIATTPPNHPDYHFARIGDLSFSRDGQLLRSVFVASRTPHDNPGLAPLLQG